MRILISGLILLALGCAPLKNTATESSGGSTTVCTAVTSSFSGPFETQAMSTGQDVNMPDRKVRVDTSTLVAPTWRGPAQLLVDKSGGGYSHFSKFTLPAGSDLVAVVDHDCTLKHGHSLNPDENDSSLTISEVIMDPSLAVVQNAKNFKIRSHTFNFTEDTTVDEMEEEAQNDPCLIMVSTDVKITTSALPNDTYYNGGGAPALLQKTQYLDAINYTLAADTKIAAIAVDVPIAIIDSGVLITHPDLSNRIWVNAGETSCVDGIDNDLNGYVDDCNGYNFASGIKDPSPQTWVGYGGAEGHGTHVAGLAAAERNNAAGGIGVMGVHAKIMALNVFGASPSASTTDINNAIYYAASKGAKVINMSLGGYGTSDSTRAAIQTAVTAGAVVVAAAGNDNLQLNSGTFITPGSYSGTITGMIAVGSIDGINSLRSSFSNCSSSIVKIGAPGAYNSSSITGGLTSTWLGNAYVNANGGSPIMGTSMATPIVAGAAGIAMALHYSANGNTFPTPAQVETYLTSTATATPALNKFFVNGRVLNLLALTNLF